MIGCGWQAESQVACIREARARDRARRRLLPDRGEAEAFCKKVGAEAGESHRDPAEQDVVVTVTTSKDPVLRGEWLQPGRARLRGRRERAAARASSTTPCSSAPSSSAATRSSRRKLESGDLIEPVERGVLDWLEVHELQEVVAGEIAGRSSPDDIVLFKSNGLAAWDVAIGAKAIELAREEESRARRL